MHEQNKEILQLTAIVNLDHFCRKFKYTTTKNIRNFSIIIMAKSEQNFHKTSSKCKQKSPFEATADRQNN